MKNNELKTQVKALNYTKKLLTGDTASILSWPAYPQKPIFRQSGRTMVPLPRAVPEEMGVDSSRLEKFIKKLANIPAAQAHCVLVGTGWKADNGRRFFSLYSKTMACLP